MFHVDSMCNDVLMFAPEQRAELQDHELVLAGKVVLQVHTLMFVCQVMPSFNMSLD